MRLNALLFAMMNKYLVYRWSYSRNLYLPFASFRSLELSRFFIEHYHKICSIPCIIVPNPHPRYA